MLRLRTVVLGALLVGVGYLWGVSGIGLRTLTAQDQQPPPDLNVSEQTANKIREANRRLNEAKEALEAEGKYETITEGLNSFLVMTGGGNARQDLESGRGVDPITFAALYAGRAIPEVQTLLGTDDQGRITYNNEVVRMYSKSRLEKLFANQSKIIELGAQ